MKVSFCLLSAPLSLAYGFHPQCCLMVKKWLLERQLSHPCTMQKKWGKMEGQKVCFSANSTELNFFFRCYWCYFCVLSKIISCTMGAMCCTLWPQTRGCIMVTLKSVCSETILFLLLQCPSFSPRPPPQSMQVQYWHSLLKTWVSCRRKLQCTKEMFQVLTLQGLSFELQKEGI